MSAHDSFEMLAGAVALGEASPEERTAFAAHAATCPSCREDADGGAFVVAQIAQAHDAETWRPSQPIVERIRARRNRRSRFTLGALGWGVGLSLVLNVAIAGGIGTRLVGAFAAHAEAPVISSAVSLDARHIAVAEPHVWHRPVIAYSGTAFKKRVRKAVTEHVGVPKPVIPPASEKLPTLDDMPDVLAGLDLYGTGSSRHHVAVETMPRCKPQSEPSAGDATDVRPCLDANGRVER